MSYGYIIHTLYRIMEHAFLAVLQPRYWIFLVHADNGGQEAADRAVDVFKDMLRAVCSNFLYSRPYSDRTEPPQRCKPHRCVESMFSRILKLHIGVYIHLYTSTYTHIYIYI